MKKKKIYEGKILGLSVYEGKLSKLRITIGNKKQIPIEFLDLVYMFEKIAQSWADVADLVQPIYNE